MTVYWQVCVLKVTTVGIRTQISLLVLQYTCPRELYVCVEHANVHVYACSITTEIWDLKSSLWSHLALRYAAWRLKHVDYMETEAWELHGG